jgi:pimeloyl-ACP methyl ester carboxylesterase
MAVSPGQGYRRTYGTGAVTAAENFVATVPSNWAADSSVIGVVQVHGYGDSAIVGWDDTGHFGSTKTPTRLAQAGYPVVACDLGGTSTWGYAPIVSRIDDAITYLQGTLKAKAGKVILMGTSMGGLNSLIYAKTKPANVAGVILIAPVNDVTWTVANNTSLATAINAIYPGNWSEATYGAGYNPITIATAGGYAGMPMLIWQGVDDTTVTLATTQALVNKIPTATLIKIPGGHSENTWSEVDPGTCLNFIAANS